MDPYSNDEISLFIQKDDKLERVLKNYSIKNFHGEWDSVCDGEFKEENKTLIISKEIKNNFSDIIVSNKITIQKNKLIQNDCTEKIRTFNKKTILKYNGTEYKESKK